MKSSARKVVCMFTIKLPTKRIFRIFPIVRTDGMASFCNLFIERPSYMELNIPVARFVSNDKLYNSKPAWDKVTDTQAIAYKDVLKSELSRIHIPVNAIMRTDVSCSDSDHFVSINHYVDCISKACLCAAECTVAHTRARGNRGCIPGWTELVAPYRSKSLFWHHMWIECGKPRTGGGL